MDDAATSSGDAARGAGAATGMAGRPVSSDSGPARLVLEHLDFSVRDGDGQSRSILSDVSFTVPAGRVFTVIGPSGSGKSTLLRAIDRLVEPTGGRVLLDGRPTTALPVQDLRRRVGMVFQAPALFDGTVLDNLLYGPRLRGEFPAAAHRHGTSPANVPGSGETPADGPSHAGHGDGTGGSDAAHDRARDLLRRVGLPPDFCDKPADQLSEGEAQRVCLARALANEPEVLLLDEPTASLDPTAARHVEGLLARLADETDLTFVFVTHDLSQARRIGDRGLLLVDGRVVEQGVLPDFLDRPDAEVTRLFRDGLLGHAGVT